MSFFRKIIRSVRFRYVCFAASPSLRLLFMSSRTKCRLKYFKIWKKLKNLPYLIRLISFLLITSSKSTVHSPKSSCFRLSSPFFTLGVICSSCGYFCALMKCCFCSSTSRKCLSANSPLFMPQIVHSPVGTLCPRADFSG